MPPPSDADVPGQPNSSRVETTLSALAPSPDATVLSTFYSDLLGKPVTYQGDGAAMIGEDGDQPVMFQQIENYQAPRWPDPAYPQQFHLDVSAQYLLIQDERCHYLVASRGTHG
jgi:glyoxalase superfamily protein